MTRTCPFSGFESNKNETAYTGRAGRRRSLRQQRAEITNRASNKQTERVFSWRTTKIGRIRIHTPRVRFFPSGRLYKTVYVGTLSTKPSPRSSPLLSSAASTPLLLQYLAVHPPTREIPLLLSSKTNKLKKGRLIKADILMAAVSGGCRRVWPRCDVANNGAHTKQPSPA